MLKCIRVRCVVRAAKRNTRQYASLLIYCSKMATTPDLGLEGATSILQEIMFVSFFFYFPFSNLFSYHVRNSDTTDDKQHVNSAGCVLQLAGFNAIYASRPPAEQEATSRACGSLSPLYCCGFQLLSIVASLSDPAICSCDL